MVLRSRLPLANFLAKSTQTSQKVIYPLTGSVSTPRMTKVGREINGIESGQHYQHYLIFKSQPTASHAMIPGNRRPYFDREFSVSCIDFPSVRYAVQSARRRTAS